MAFAETRLDVGIRYGVAGGPEFNTGVIVVSSGYEQRNQNWSDARGKWDLADDVYSKAELDLLLAFFRNRKGKFQGFRFKDWSDFKVEGYNSYLAVIPSISVGTLQMQKSYTDFLGSTYRSLKKIVPNSDVVSYLGNPLVRDIDYTINYNNGRMDITPLSFTNVDANLVGEFLTGITKANPGVVSVSAHPFNTGDLVYMNNVGGMTQLNNRTFQITRINNNAFSIGIDTTAYSTWVDNGLLNLAIIARRSISRTNPVRIYKTAHGFLDNAQISISATSGMEQLNNRFFTVTNSTANYFDLLGIDGSAYTPYLANGSILEYRDIAQYTFLCEFDIPVRFDTDKFSASFDAYRDSDGESLFTISSLPVIEIRV